MGFFGLGTEKKSDVEENKKEEEDEGNDEEETEEEDGQESENNKVLIDILSKATEKQLLKLLVIMSYEKQYENLAGDSDRMKKIVMEDE